MASIRKEILVKVAPDVLWDALRDVGALHTRLVPGFVVDTQLQPGARMVTFGSGQVVREIIVDVNEADRRVVWAITDEPFRHYNASAQVSAAGPETTRFVWIADLLPNDLKDHVAGMMDEGLLAIRRTFERARS